LEKQLQERLELDIPKANKIIEELTAVFEQYQD
jgi:hypothetical protein